jgi:hypothetical protein
LNVFFGFGELKPFGPLGPTGAIGGPIILLGRAVAAVIDVIPLNCLAFIGNFGVVLNPLGMIISTKISR